MFFFPFGFGFVDLKNDKFTERCLHIGVFGAWGIGKDAQVLHTMKCPDPTIFDFSWGMSSVSYGTVADSVTAEKSSVTPFVTKLYATTDFHDKRAQVCRCGLPD